MHGDRASEPTFRCRTSASGTRFRFPYERVSGRRRPCASEAPAPASTGNLNRTLDRIRTYVLCSPQAAHRRMVRAWAGHHSIRRVSAYEALIESADDPPDRARSCKCIGRPGSRRRAELLRTHHHISTRKNRPNSRSFSPGFQPWVWLVTTQATITPDVFRGRSHRRNPNAFDRKSNRVPFSS